MSFCSRAALASHEALAGTGVRGAAYVFLPVPKRFWRDAEFNESWATPREIDAIRQARRAGVVTRLYNPPVGGDAAVFVYARDARARSVALSNLEPAWGERWRIEAAESPRLAVCTQGTRDRCCAKWGFAVYIKARRLFEAGRSAFEPLECSHLGGDRFAATGVFLPSGSMYAHLDSLDLEALSAAEARGAIDAAHYRGRIFDPQLTLVVRAGLARDGLLDHATAPLTLTPWDDDASQLRVTEAPGGRTFLVALTERDVRFYPDCADLAEGRTSSARRTVYAGGKLAPDA